MDLGSSLRSYQWCISPADVVGSCTVLPSENVGLVTRAERKLLSPVTNGTCSPKLSFKVNGYTKHAWLLIQSRLTALLTSLIARR